MAKASNKSTFSFASCSLYDSAIVLAVTCKSSRSGFGIDKNNPLFIFDASKRQFDIPIKAIFLLPSFKSYSNSE